MASKFRNIPKVLFFIAAALYPGLIFYFLVIRKTPLRLFSLFVIAFALIAFITGTSRKKENKGFSFFWNSALLLGLSVLCLIINSTVILKLYPLLMNIIFLTAFGGTLFSPPSMIFRFATMQDKSIKGSQNEKRVAAYCRKVTIVWCVFFICNGSIAAWTIFSGSDALWSVYNGGISYILIGALFAGEFMVRKMVQKKMPKNVPLSTFRNAEKITAESGNFENADAASEGFGRLDKEKIIEKTENSVSVEFSIPGANPYFDGHFPGFPILPAVSQAELVIRYAARHLGTNVSPVEIKRVKFTNFIRPDAPLLLKLTKKEKTISFNISSPENETVYSTGTIIRVYPVDASLRITRSLFFNKRMGFDTEILVRLYWKKVFPLFHPIKVIYPKDGVSNFHMVRDNISISLMFSRLFIGMILRLPLLIAIKIKRGKKRR
jgi:uncharacterized membrane protein/3-hydroxymyristoyl/3-hydroxydecanoyl-(acyl carrier protein) dehydratase